MKKYLVLILLFSILMSGCAKHNRIDFSSSESFFSSLSEKKIIRKEKTSDTFKLNNLKKIKINNAKKKNN